ncbi:telomeric repeat binding factor a isoform X2 [Nerophis ophidion]|uniref:telomeric repeat binding factor a isoform X2 n=1 Tax=Nerophis ophidion TaxID=159077 RepID=UPI002ADF0F2D|nr:telomeric repeat binding factor a isoform X2 [Nerophis ophidion]
MADEETESIVNRWIVDYYVSLAIETFRSDQYEDFCEIRNVIECILHRPVATNTIIPTKLEILQILSRINEGENIDLSFETDSSVTPLESALNLLEKMSEKSDVPQKDLKHLCTSVREMMMMILIKNKEFNRAKELLGKHFRQPKVAKKTLFTNLISLRTNKHKVIEEMDMRELKEEALTFLLKLCPYTLPFLSKAAKQLLKERDKRGYNSTTAEGPDNDVELNPASPNKNVTEFTQLLMSDYSFIEKSRLMSAYQALATGGLLLSFSQLEDILGNEKLETRFLVSARDDTSKDPELDERFQRDSGSPVEAAPAGPHAQNDVPSQSKTGSPQTTHTRRKRQLYTVSKFVMEPDSQESSASQAREAAVRGEEQGQSQIVPNADEAVVCTKRPRRVTKRFPANEAEESAQSEEQSPSAASKQAPQTQHHNRSSPNRKYTEPEELALNSEDEVQDSTFNYNKTPVHRNAGAANKDEVVIIDSLDRSPSSDDHQSTPQKSSTPTKQARDSRPAHSKWKDLCSKAKETKVVWSDDDIHCDESSCRSSFSGQKRRMWTEEETEKLKSAVKRFGEGNWRKIKSYYVFSDRTNVQLKDRWRTMKKLNLV